MTKVKNMFFFNAFFRYMVTSFISLCQKTLSTYVAVRCVMALYPLGIGLLLQYQFDSLAKLNDKMGSLYSGIRLNSRVAVLYSSVFQLRRFTVVMLT